MNTLDLIGPMLGAAHAYIEGEAVHCRTEDDSSEQRTEYRFWADQTDLRVERSDGVVLVRGRDRSGDPLEQVTYRRKILERGPHLGPGRHEVERLLMPRSALIWGRPGEDWRLTEQVHELARDRVRIRLASTQGEDGAAFIEVDPDSGRLWTITVPGERWEITSLRDHPADGRDPTFRFVV